jgi:Trypsin
LSSNNSQFDIKAIQVNGVPQVCKKNEKQVWPEKKSLTDPTPIDNSTASEPNCGQIKKSDLIDFLDLPSSPGEFPWHVAIYRYFDDEEETYYKCAGTIIGKRTVVTSFNCLLEDGLLLERAELQVYVAPFSLSSKKQKSKSYKIGKIFPHEGVNYQLDNNLAVLELTRDIMFNDYVQPICLPEEDYNPQGKIGKVHNKFRHFSIRVLKILQLVRRVRKIIFEISC